MITIKYFLFFTCSCIILNTKQIFHQMNYFQYYLFYKLLIYLHWLRPQNCIFIKTKTEAQIKPKSELVVIFNNLTLICGLEILYIMHAPMRPLTHPVFLPSLLLLRLHQLNRSITRAVNHQPSINVCPQSPPHLPPTPHSRVVLPCIWLSK